MGRRGPLPKSPELRSISGSERRKPKENPIGLSLAQLKSIAPLNALPPVPKWMRNAYAREEYLEVGAELIEAGLLTRSNHKFFCMGCVCAGILITGMDERSEYAQVNQTLLVQYKAVITEFGLTPASQIRKAAGGAPAAEPEQPTNPFAVNKRKAA